MAMFTKQSSPKRAVPAEEISMNYETIKVSYSRPQTRTKLLQTGLSARGIDELMNGIALSDPKDRQISAAIIGEAVK